MNIAGLLAHPLLVHLAVIFVPMSAVAFALVMWRTSWRRQYGWLIVAAAVIGAVGAFLAAQSGESLEHALRQTTGTRVRLGDHPDQGDTAEIFAMLFAVVAAAAWTIEQYGAQWGLPAWAFRVAYVLGVCVAIGAIVTIVIAGDSGARLVWQQLGTFVKPR